MITSSSDPNEPANSPTTTPTAAVEPIADFITESTISAAAAAELRGADTTASAEVAAEVAPDAEDEDDDEDDDAAFEAKLTKAQAATYERLAPVLSICVSACEFLWHLSHKQPILDELRSRTGLNPGALRRMGDIKTPAAMEHAWDHDLVAYYYTLLVGRLVLETPVRPLFCALLSTNPKEAAQLDRLVAESIQFVRNSAPLTERWLIGERGAGANDPPPDDPDRRAELAGWATRRERLENYFKDAKPSFQRMATWLREQVPARGAHASSATPTVPERRGPFLRRTFTDAELAALRLLLTYVPTLATLLPGHPFALAMNTLSALQPPAHVAELLQRLRAIKPGQALHFTLADSLSLFQTLQCGALLLLRVSSSDLVRALRRHADDPNDPDEDLRTERGRLLFLLTNDLTRSQFRATFGPLLKSFIAAVDRTYPHNPALTQARTELADLAAVR